jgi:uncharacterized membrane protein YfcA
MRVLLPGAVLGVAAGGLLFGVMSDRAVKGLVGAIALAFLARTAWVALRRGAARRAESSALRGSVWATLSGITSTVAHAGGPPLAVYLYPLGLDRRTLVATTVVFFALVNYLKLVPYALLGVLSAQNLLTSLVLLPLAPAGVYLGIWMQKRVSDAMFYRVLYALLLVTGVKLTWDGVVGS